MHILRLLEARRNPEVNVRASVNDELERWFRQVELVKNNLYVYESG